MRPLDRRIVGLAVPALGAMAVEPLYGLVDTAIVDRLGRSELGGLAVALTALNLGICRAGFLAMVTSQRVAFRTGSGDELAQPEQPSPPWACRSSCVCWPARGTEEGWPTPGRRCASWWWPTW